MKRKLGLFCMLLGAVLVIAAMVLLFSNRKEENTAENFTNSALPALQEEIAQVQTKVDVIPMELPQPEDLTMTEKVLDGYVYIGYLRIRDLNLELPVMSGWSTEQLQISPCRFSGTVRGEDLVIMAHNYRAHFGSLSQLQPGAAVQFVDMDGMVWNYEVVVTDVLAAQNVEEMTAGDYDLTLFTCTANRTHRVTVRCDLSE